MNAKLWKKVDDLLDAALELPPEEREQFVAEACDGNDELREEVLSLIKAQSHASHFMERSAMKVAAQALANDSNLTTHASLLGKEISTYKVEAVLGTGGMGEVYLAHETKLNRKVALKILPRHFVVNIERLNRFEREARALSALNHPNLITIFELGEFNGLHYIAMEFVEGQTLRSMISGNMKLREILSMAAQVAEALEAAHRSGIIHRDIKPDNIMVRADHYVKVLDFGLAKLTEVRGSGSQPDVAQTQAGTAMGTLAYMSPEQATGEVIDHRTDIWSLGVVLYELVTGVKPFRGENRQATVNAILSSEPDSASGTKANLPFELDSILEKALEKDRELRYQTASDLRADLLRLIRAIDSSPTNSRSRVLSAAAKQTITRRRTWIGVAIAASLLVGVIVVWWLFIRSRSRAPDWTRAAQVQLTDQAGTEFFPSLAPDGKTFVYAARVNNNFDLFLKRVGGKNPILLTKDSPADDSQAVFSPAGTHIAFRSDREPAGIYVMEATGENIRPLTRGGFHPSWSPDGNEIVFSTAGRDIPSVRNTFPSSLWIVNAQTGATRLFSKIDAMQPAWSPHGSRIAYWFMPPGVGRSDIASLPRNGGEPVVITTDASTNWNPVWSPDGQYLYFASDRSGSMGFWRVRIDEETGKPLAEPEAVVTPSKFNRHLSFSHDGKRMIYVQTDEQSNIQGAEFDARSEKLVAEPSWITRGDRLVVRPELSADQKRFVLRLPRRTQDDIVVVNRDGTNWRDITNDKYFDRYPRWAPDGRRVAFVSDRSGSYEVWIADVDTTNLTQVTFNSPPGTSFPLWSPDGKQLLLRRNEENWIIDASKTWNEQTPQALPQPGPTDHFVAWDWSPDGQKLIGGFGGSQQGIGYFSFQTQRYEKVSDYEPPTVWMPDSRRFIFAQEGKAYLGDIITKIVRELPLRTREQIRSVAVSGDGRLIYFTAFSTESDIWLLDLE